MRTKRLSNKIITLALALGTGFPVYATNLGPDSKMISAAITCFPTLLGMATTDATKLSASKMAADLKNAQGDAIAYMQETSEGRTGTWTPALQLGVETASQFPETRELSRDQLILAIALADLDLEEFL